MEEELTNFNNYIEYLSYCNHREVHNFIEIAEVGLALLHPLPKYQKNIPQKIFEYMACKKPVVATDLASLRNFILSANCGILCPGKDLSQITSAIRYLLVNPEEAQRMGERGYEAVKREWNWGKMEEKLLGLYRSL